MVHKGTAARASIQSNQPIKVKKTFSGTVQNTPLAAKLALLEMGARSSFIMPSVYKIPFHWNLSTGYNCYNLKCRFLPWLVPEPAAGKSRENSAG